MDGFVSIRLPALVTPKEQEAAAREPKGQENLETSRADEAADEVLLARIASGEQNALALLFRRYAGMVRRVAYRVLRDVSEADDMLQDVFLLIHGNCSSFDPAKGPARSWIMQMTF